MMVELDGGIGRPLDADQRSRVWYAPHRAIIALGTLLIVVSIAGGMLGVVNSSNAENAIATISGRYLVIGKPVTKIRSAIADFQLIAAPIIAGAATNSTVIGLGVKDANAADTAYLNLAHLLALPGNGTLAPLLATKMAAYVAARSNLGAFVAGEKTSPALAAFATVEQAADENLDTALASLQVTLNTGLLGAANAAQRASNAARLGLLWCLGIGGAWAIVVTWLFARKATRVEHEVARKDAIQLALTDRNEFESRLQRALEMSKHEEPVFDLVAEALNEAARDHPAELLLADSSRALFRRVLVSDAMSGATGCGVVSPNDCPAAARGQTLIFPNSTAMDACPHLRGRACSALCVPVSISGNSIGVFHVTATDGVAPADSVRRDVEVVARRASERLAMLRAFELSNAQANTDSLTGLLTRRSLESGVRDLLDGGITYAVAYGDLDNFKQLNDAFGHDAGDRALRTFAQVLRDSLRPADISSRYGGEEFVIVLPECPVPEAVQVLERVMQRTAERLVGGRHPTFTVSFGVASSDQAQDFQSVVTLADQALLEAKSGGRNRIAVASALGMVYPHEEAPSETPIEVVV
jgi:diguanylate cyclase (GGDEF)-like protein